MRTLATPLTLALAACVLATSATSAALASSDPTAAPPSIGTASAVKTPPLYAVAQSAPISAPSGTQTAGTVSCPAGTVVLGGGALVAASSPATTLASSYPMSNGGGWVAAVNNTSGTAQSFTVQAVCAKRPRHYAVLASGPLSVHAGSAAAAALPCPDAQRPFGGGAQSGSSSVAVGLQDTFPQREFNAWEVDVNNNTSADQSFRVFVICARPPRTYNVAMGTITPLPPGSQRQVTATCPTGRPLGGGALTTTSSPAVALESSAVTPNGWSASEDNTGLFPGVIVVAFVVCA
jgi:hypothetical protein